MDRAFVVVESFPAGGLYDYITIFVAMFDAVWRHAVVVEHFQRVTPLALLRSIEAVLHQLLDHYSLTASMPGRAHTSRFTRRALLAGGSRQRLISVLIACRMSEHRLYMYNHVMLSSHSSCDIANVDSLFTL